MNSVLILKSRFIQEINHAANKTEYIGEREGVVLDEFDNIQLLKSPDGIYLRRKEDGKAIELKGSIKDKESLDEIFEEEGYLYGAITEDIRKYVDYHYERPGSNGIFGATKDITVEEEKTKLHKHMQKDNSFLWDWVLSLREDDHEALGMNKKKWERIINNKLMPEIEKELNTKLHWYGAYHYKKGHPHIHLLFYDENNKIRKAKMPKNMIGKFKRIVINEINYEEKKIIYRKKENYQKEIINQVDSALLKRHRRDLRAVLRGSNTFRYKYLSEIQKGLVDKIVDEILNSSNCKEIVEKYNEEQKQLIKMYDSNEESINKKLDENINKVLKAKIANKVLKMTKENLNDNKNYDEKQDVKKVPKKLNEKDERVLKYGNKKFKETSAGVNEKVKKTSKGVIKEVDQEEYEQTKRKKKIAKNITDVKEVLDSFNYNKTMAEKDKEVKKIEELKKQNWEMYI